jgi:hypothetical protein
LLTLRLGARQYFSACAHLPRVTSLTVTIINHVATLKDFKRMFKALLKRAHRDEQHGGEEWVHIGFGSGESEAFPIYFNWKTTEMIEMLAIVFCDISSSFVA